MDGWQGLEAGKMMVIKNERGKCMDPLGQVIGSNLAEIKGNLFYGGLFNITGLYSHSQPPTGLPGQHLHP